MSYKPSYPFEVVSIKGNYCLGAYRNLKEATDKFEHLKVSRAVNADEIRADGFRIVKYVPEVVTAFAPVKKVDKS